jgi:hypothetical protein
LSTKRTLRACRTRRRKRLPGEQQKRREDEKHLGHAHKGVAFQQIGLVSRRLPDANQIQCDASHFPLADGVLGTA